MGSGNAVQSSKRKRSLMAVGAAAAVVAVFLLYQLSRPRNIEDLVQRRGAPVLMAREVRMEHWDPDSTAVVRSLQLTVQAPRDWSDQFVPTSECVLVYCDSRSLVTYWEMFRDGEIHARRSATLALGERVTATCYDVGADGSINRTWKATFTFVSFRKDEAQ